MAKFYALEVGPDYYRIYETQAQSEESEELFVLMEMWKLDGSDVMPSTPLTSTSEKGNACKLLQKSPCLSNSPPKEVVNKVASDNTLPGKTTSIKSGQKPAHSVSDIPIIPGLNRSSGEEEDKIAIPLAFQNFSMLTPKTEIMPLKKVKMNIQPTVIVFDNTKPVNGLSSKEYVTNHPQTKFVEQGSNTSGLKVSSTGANIKAGIEKVLCSPKITANQSVQPTAGKGKKIIKSKIDSSWKNGYPSLASKSTTVWGRNHISKPNDSVLHVKEGLSMTCGRSAQKKTLPESIKHSYSSGRLMQLPLQEAVCKEPNKQLGEHAMKKSCKGRVMFSQMPK